MGKSSSGGEQERRCSSSVETRVADFRWLPGEGRQRSEGRGGGMENRDAEGGRSEPR